MAVIWLEIGVEVLLAIDLVDERVETVAVISVLIEKVNPGDVFSNFQVLVERNHSVFVVFDILATDLLSVNPKIIDLLAHEFKEDGWILRPRHRRQIKIDRSLAQEVLSLCQCNSESVVYS